MTKKRIKPLRKMTPKRRKKIKKKQAKYNKKYFPSSYTTKLKDTRTFRGKKYNKGTEVYTNKIEIASAKKHLRQLGYSVRTVPYKYKGKRKYRLYLRK